MRFGPLEGPCEAVAVFSRVAGNGSATGGCSGLLWNHGGSTWGLTNGSAIWPLLETEEKLRDVVEMVRSRRRRPGEDNGDAATVLRSLPHLADLELRVQREGESPDFDASVVDVWCCPSLSAAFDQLVSSGWDFFEAGDRMLNSIVSMLVLFRPTTDGASGVSSVAALEALLQLVHRGGLSRGSSVLAVTSPFAGVSVSQNKSAKAPLEGGVRGEEGDGRKGCPPCPPSPFLNSWSEGVVSAVGLPGGSPLFLTDARATVGSEGGPVFVRGRGGGWTLAGMVLVPLCHWRGEWLGFSLACYLEATLRTFVVASASSMGRELPETGNEEQGGHNTRSLISSCPVVLVKCGYTQGSGIPINGKLGLILTCAHVVRKHHMGLTVSWLKGKTSVTMDANVVYLTAPNLAYDVAVISVGPGTDLSTIHISRELPEQGDIVWLVGYSMYSQPRYSVLEPPLLSRGIVSSVMPGKLPSLLQTTCCVQAGSSGGAVIREKDGTLIAVMVCNTAVEHFETGSLKSQVAVHPSINFAIPAVTLSDTLDRYYETGDPSVLTAFQSRDERVQQIWKLKLLEPERSKL